MPRRNIQVVVVVGIVAAILITVIVTLATGESQDAAPTPTPGLSATVPIGPTPTSGPTPTATQTTPSTPVPSPTPTATPTPTSTPTPTPTPEPPDIVFITMAFLAAELSAPASEFSLVSYEQAVWPSADLGCPEPGAFYAQAQTSGWIFFIERNSETTEYHFDETGEVIANCTTNRQAFESAINLVEEAGLAGASRIDIGRRTSSGDYNLVATIEDPDVIRQLVDILDLPIARTAVTECLPVFEVTLATAGGDQTFQIICSGNTRLIRGNQAFWEGMDGIAPAELASLIGPFVSGGPPPGLPSGSSQ